MIGCGLIAAGLALISPEVSRLAKRAFGIPAELSGPHRYNLRPSEDLLVTGSSDFIYCALSMVDGRGGSCALVHGADGWHVAANAAAASCAVTCLK